jgi:hypothetical protein
MTKGYSAIKGFFNKFYLIAVHQQQIDYTMSTKIKVADD